MPVPITSVFILEIFQVKLNPSLHLSRVEIEGALLAVDPVHVEVEDRRVRLDDLRAVQVVVTLLDVSSPLSAFVLHQDESDVLICNSAN